MKLVHENGPFQVFRNASKIAIFEDGEFYCQHFKGSHPRAYRDPAWLIADILDSRAEAEADKIMARLARKRARQEIVRNKSRLRNRQMELFA